MGYKNFKLPPKGGSLLLILANQCLSYSHFTEMTIYQKNFEVNDNKIVFRRKRYYF